MQTRSWFKVDVHFFDHPLISTLSDTQKVAFLLLVAKSKQLRRGGEFKDRRHLAVVLGQPYARAIPRFIAEGVLVESLTGQITMPTYSQWQVDPTSTERQRQHRARKGLESRNVTTLDRDRDRDRERERDSTKANGLVSLDEILHGRTK